MSRLSRPTTIAVVLLFHALDSIVERRIPRLADFRPEASVVVEPWNGRLAGREL